MMRCYVNMKVILIHFFLQFMLVFVIIMFQNQVKHLWEPIEYLLFIKRAITSNADDILFWE